MDKEVIDPEEVRRVVTKILDFMDREAPDENMAVWLSAFNWIIESTEKEFGMVPVMTKRLDQ